MSHFYTSKDRIKTEFKLKKNITCSPINAKKKPN